MPEQYYDLGYSGDQVNEAIGRMLSGDVEAAVAEAQQYAENAEAAGANATVSAEAAQEASQQIQNMTVEAETVSAGTPASVEKTISEEGVVNLKLSIPKGADGQKGNDGDAGKSAYQQAVAGGYTGTETQFNAMLASGPWLSRSGNPGLTGDTLMFLDGQYGLKFGYDTSGFFLNLENEYTVGAPILVRNVATPTFSTDAANKGYVDDAVESAGSDVIQGDSVVIGPNASATNNGINGSIVIGYNAKDISTSGAGVAIGFGANTNGYSAIALGSYATAKNSSSIAIGSGATGCYSGSIAVGYTSYSSGSYSIAIGGGARATTVNSIALGMCAYSGYDRSISIGENASSLDTYSIAIGYLAEARGTACVALGCYAHAYGGNSVALGQGASTSGSDWSTIQLGDSYLSVLRCHVSLSVTSDMRDKTDITPISDGAVSLLEKITPISYYRNPRIAYIDTEHLSEADAENRRKFGLCEYDREAHAAGEKKGSRRRVGVSAQAVQEALVEVYGSASYANIVNDNLYDVDQAEIPEGVESQLTVNYEGFIPFLIKAVQELSARVKELEENQK